MTKSTQEPTRPMRVHPHPSPRRDEDVRVDVVVVGGGHAGVEAALAAARVGARVALCTFRLDLIGEMSCNPAIGGLGKGQLAREIDALGGAMGRATDATGIQFRMLNTAKGLAVQAPRAQSDRHRYREEITRIVHGAAGVELVGGGVSGLLVRDVDGSKRGRREVIGVRLNDGTELRSHAVVVTTGTFLRAVMHTGDSQESGGRVGEDSCEGLSSEFELLGLPLGRLKTGTPPRLEKASIAWDRLEPQLGDAKPSPFSFATDPDAFPLLEQVACHITYTNPRCHDIIRANIHRAPMYAGRIDGVGPRYCPSVEDKVMRFGDRDRHQIFLEPEGLDTDSIYVNGVSTSLPAELQEAFLHEVDGLEHARFLRYGYAVEYDFVQPAALDPSLHVRTVGGLYLAGQINGTSGYEEAGAQGLMAGANAALWSLDRAPFVLERHEAYIGVLIDDLVVTNPTEPYRMFTSRAEYRLMLRQDDADRRLTRLADTFGLADSEALARLDRRESAMEKLTRTLDATRVTGDPSSNLTRHLRRPDVTLDGLLTEHPSLAEEPFAADIRRTVEADIKYAGYVERQRKEVARMRRQESTVIPPHFDFSTLSGLRGEAREKLSAMRPATLGAASRIAGINPPDVALLAVHLGKRGDTVRGDTVPGARSRT